MNVGIHQHWLPGENPILVLARIDSTNADVTEATSASSNLAAPRTGNLPVRVLVGPDGVPRVVLRRFGEFPNPWKESPGFF
jgi:hypothetical protein